MADSDFGGQGVSDIKAHWWRYLLRSEQVRGVRDGVAEGKSFSVIAEGLDASVEVIEELAASLDRGVDVDVSAYELIVRAHVVEGSDRRELVEQLSEWQYTDSRTVLPWPMHGQSSDLGRLWSEQAGCKGY